MSNENRLEIDVEILKREVTSISQLFAKLDSAIDKIGDAAGGISRMLAVHDEKISLNERVDHELFALIEKHQVESQANIKELHSRITTNQRELGNDIQVMETRIMTAIKDLKDDIDKNRSSIIEDTKKLGERVATLEKWRWIVVGGGIMIGLILSKLDLIIKYIN